MSLNKSRSIPFCCWIFIPLISILLQGCSGLGEEISEGKITYQVTYPKFKNDMMLAILPDELEFTFKANKYKNKVLKRGWFSSEMIADCNSRTLVMTLELTLKRIYSEIDSSKTNLMLENYPSPEITFTEELDTVAGIKCKKAIAYFKDWGSEGVKVDLYYTDRIAIKEPNWCNQYKEIPGVLLAYELNQFGLRMKMRASKVEEITIQYSNFKPKKAYREVSLDHILYDMEELFHALL